MTIDRAIRVLAGTFVLLSLVLFHFIGPAALWLTAFVGANLLQSAFTGFCPAATVMRKLGVPDATCAPRGDARGV